MHRFTAAVAVAVLAAAVATVTDAQTVSPVDRTFAAQQQCHLSARGQNVTVTRGTAIGSFAFGLGVGQGNSASEGAVVIGGAGKAPTGDASENLATTPGPTYGPSPINSMQTSSSGCSAYGDAPAAVTHCADGEQNLQNLCFNLQQDDAVNAAGTVSLLTVTDK